MAIVYTAKTVSVNKDEEDKVMNVKSIKSAEEFAAILSASGINSWDLTGIIKELESIVMTTDEVVKSVIVSKTAGKNPKTKKGISQTVRTVTEIKTGKKVIDTQATISAKREFMAGVLKSEGITNARVIKTSKKIVNSAEVKARIAKRQQHINELTQAKADRIESAKYSIYLSKFEGEIERIEEQIKVLRAFTPRANFKARKKDAPKVNVKAPKVRKRVKPLSKVIPMTCPCYDIKVAPITVRPSSHVVTREEAIALHRSVYGSDNVISITHNATNDSLPFAKYLAQAEVINAKSKTIWGDLTMNFKMSQKQILIEVHNDAMDAIGAGTESNYEDAVLNGYESTMERLGLTLTNELEDAILYMADTECMLNNVEEDGNARINKVLAMDPNELYALYNRKADELEAEALTYGGDVADDLANTIHEWMSTITVLEFLKYELALQLSFGGRNPVINGEFFEGYFYDQFDKDGWIAMLDKDANFIESQEGFSADVWTAFGRSFMNKDETKLNRIVVKGGEDNLDKNLDVLDSLEEESFDDEEVIEISEPKVEIIPVVIDEEYSMTFEEAFKTPYAEVAPIISYGDIADIAWTSDSNAGINFAESISNLIYKTVTIGKFVKNVKPEVKARMERKNARAEEARNEFLSKYGEKLGSIYPINLHYASGSAFAKRCPKVIKDFFLNNFALCKENGDKKEYLGLEYDFSQSYQEIPGVGLALWVSLLAKATAFLSPLERAELLGFLFFNVATVNETVVTRGSISIDLGNGIVKTSGRVLRANKASCLGRVGKNFFVVDGLHAVFLFAIQALGGTAKQLETSVNLAIKLFSPEHNYGHQPDEDDISFFVRDNLVYANDLSVRSSFPHFEILGGKQAGDFLSWVLSKGIPAVSDKTNIKFVTINDGAVATGMGFHSDGNIKTCNDVNKVAKLTNRNAANNYDCADLPDRVASNFGFALPSGKVAHTKGKLMKVGFSNSVSGFGSGVGAMNLSSSVTYIVGKKEKEAVNFSIFGKGAMGSQKFKDGFVKAVNDAFEVAANEHKVVEPKGTILSLNIGGKDYVLVHNSSDAATVVVTGGHVKLNPRNFNEVEVVAEVDIVETTQWFKARRFATKFTTLPYDVRGLRGEWDILLNNETTKGQGALLEMFANQSGKEWRLISEEGLLVSDDQVINLMEENNDFNTWKNESIVEETIRFEMAKSTYESHKLLKEDDEYKWAAEVRLVKDYGDYVTVEEDIDVIYGELVFDVEISTPLESVSRSNFTLESAAAISLQNKELGSVLFDECIGKVDKFNALIDAYAINKKMPVFNVLNAELRAGITNSIFPDGTVGLKQRNIVAKIAAKYPEGIKFRVGNTDLALDLNVIANFGSFSFTTGSAARESAELVNFIIDIFVNDAKEAKSLVKEAGWAYNRLVKTAVDSKNVLKKPTRSGKLIYGKVRTSYHPMLNSVDGIPTIVMNRECPIVRLLGIKTESIEVLEPGKTEVKTEVDHFVGFSRTPMPFLGAARVKLTDDDSICGVAHVLVDPLVWHALNEGDSDGDGIAVINLETVKGFTVTKEIVMSINAAKMGIGGYKYLYGENLPYVDFVSIADKEGKKSLRGNKCLVNTHIKGKVISAEFLGIFAAKVAFHYRSAVGTSYGICSKLIFDAVDCSARTDAKSKDLTSTLIDASLISWRLLYEGLGLSGYSADAAKVFEIIHYASMNFNDQFRVYKKGNEYDVAFAHNDGLVKGYFELVGATKDLNEVYKKVGITPFIKILMARSVTKTMPKLEGYSEMKSYWAPLQSAATRFGALRRISQGNDQVENLLGLKEEARAEADQEFVAKPLSVWFMEIIDAPTAFSNQQLGELAAKVCKFHARLIQRKQELVDVANAGE